jgi:hypothetical protein
MLRFRLSLLNIIHSLLACRTLHTAEDAAEGAEKWVFQLWLCTGLPTRPKVDAAAMAAQQLAAQRKGGVSPQKPKRAKKKQR